MGALLVSHLKLLDGRGGEAELLGVSAHELRRVTEDAPRRIGNEPPSVRATLHQQTGPEQVTRLFERRDGLTKDRERLTVPVRGHLAADEIGDEAIPHLARLRAEVPRWKQRFF